MRRTGLIALIALAAGLAFGEEAPKPKDETAPAAAQQEKEDEKAAGDQAQTDQGPKSLSGMSILGNREAPKSLVIVPWKSSELGAEVGIATMLDDSKLPIDKEVFLRSLLYYEIRSGRK